MIPKVIHYCWFGGNTKPASVLKCIESWKKYCPDYEIREWNEENFPVGDNLYCKQAYEAKKWAFATDYARLVIVYNNGGIYLDTDVEVIKPLDDLLNHKFFIGRQQGFQVNTGSGFGAAGSLGFGAGGGVGKLTSMIACFGHTVTHLRHKRHFVWSM